MRDALSRFLFAVILGGALLCFGLWFYRKADTANVVPQVVQFATIGACVACVAVGLLFLFFALKLAGRQRESESLLRIALVLASGAFLIGFGFWFYRGETMVLEREEREWQRAVRSPEMANAKEGGDYDYASRIVAAALEVHQKSKGLLSPAEVENRTLRASESAVEIIRRERRIVALGSGACAILGLLFVILGLRMWWTSNQSSDRALAS